MTTTTAAITPTIRPGLGRQYTAEILDRKTGEMVSIDRGHWVTMEELSKAFGIGKRQLATVLHQMNFLQIEGTGRNARNRIRDWVIAKGYGKRNKRKSDGMPFDVVSSEGFRWIVERWEAAKKAVEEKTSGPAKEAREALQAFQKRRSGPMGGQQEIHWVADHFPHLTHDQMAQALSLSRQLVTRFMRIRSEQIANAKALRKRHRKPTGTPRGMLHGRPIHKKATPRKMTAGAGDSLDPVAPAGPCADLAEDTEGNTYSERYCSSVELIT